MSNKCFVKVLKEDFNGDLPRYGELKFKFNSSASNNNINITYKETGVVKSNKPFTYNGDTYTELSVGNVEKQLIFPSNDGIEFTVEKYKVGSLFFNGGVSLVDFDTKIIRNSGLNKLFVNGSPTNSAYFNLEDFKDFLQIRYYYSTGIIKSMDISTVAQLNPNIRELTIGNAPDLFGSLETYLERLLRVRTDFTNALVFNISHSNILFNNTAIPASLKILFTATTITVKNSGETTTYGTYTQGSGWSY